MTRRIYEVDPELITDFWSLVSPMLSRAIEFNPHLEMDGLLQILIARYASLIIMTDENGLRAAAVMQRIQYPTIFVGSVLALAGEKGTYGKPMDELIDYMEGWAKSRGCSRIDFVGRAGLLKIVKQRKGSSVDLIHAWRDI